MAKAKARRKNRFPASLLGMNPLAQPSLVKQSGGVDGLVWYILVAEVEPMSHCRAKSVSLSLSRSLYWASGNYSPHSSTIQ